MLASSLCKAKERALSESMLVDAFYEKVDICLGVKRAKCLVEREVVVGKNIADVVILVNEITYKCNAFLCSPSALTVKESVVISTLRANGNMLKSSVAEYCGLDLNAESERTVFSHLAKIGFIKETHQGYLSLTPQWKSAFKKNKIIAIEAKLVNWREALNQAAQYLRYANESYVVLPDYTADKALQYKSMFNHFGVGLISMHADTFLTLIPAMTIADHTNDWRREYIVSKLTVNFHNRTDRNLA